METVRPALRAIGRHSLAAEQLILGTAIQESDLVHRRQLGGGPGRGLLQMEPATHDDIWANFLNYRVELADRVSALRSVPSADGIEELECNDRYAVAMARVHYLRVPAALPKVGDLGAMAAYWKRYYNTMMGRGREEQFVNKWRRIVPAAGLPDSAVER